jgi:endonuclease YncB( thermonuclease family)
MAGFSTRKLVAATPGGARRLLHGFVGLGATPASYDLAAPLPAKPVRSVAQSVTDGDSLSVRTLGNLGLRLLGLDAPETKIQLPGKDGRQGGTWLALDNTEVAAFLDDPFDAARYGPFPQPEGDASAGGFLAHLRRLLPKGGGQRAAANHRRHAKAAERRLEEMIREDIAAFSGGDATRHELHIAFANEVFDRYGRLLGHVNASVAERDRRPPSLNERLLAEGLALPFFVWPNVEPFLGLPLAKAVPAPKELDALLASPAARRLAAARAAVAAARTQPMGVFAAGDPLLLAASELRLLAGRRLPERWVIDLSGHGGVLRRPTDHHLVANPEDRLFVPPEFAPLFAERGWRLG